MRILWITNIPIGKHCELTKTYQTGGGWMTAALEMLKGNNSFEICIATTWPIKKKIAIKELNIDYTLLPGGYPIRYNPNKKSNVEEWKQLVSQFNPDIIHIHGTESSHGFALMNACPNYKYIISIQGLCSVIERYYYAGIDISMILKNITIRDILRWDTIIQARRKFQQRGAIEIEYIKRSRHIIGRTSWDYVHAKAINPSINYHFCNEILRDSFYSALKWDVNCKKDYTIFISKATNPIKGLHQVLKAIALLKTDFPEITVRIAGLNNIKNKSFMEKIKLTGYGAYIRSIIDRLNLHEQVWFTGSLLEEQMVSEYRNAHVFVCPSSIENSSNSIGEAQMVGTPCVASYAGGISDMIENGETGLLYRFEEYEMLAHQIRKIFENDNLALRLSEAARIVAFERHDRVKNTNILVEIYKKILN